MTTFAEAIQTWLELATKTADEHNLELDLLMRALMIDEDDEFVYDVPAELAAQAREAAQALWAHEGEPWARHALSEILLVESLCPMHRCDYAICFDDEDPECSQIREYFPNHDT